jgi:hypothetical protein
MSILNLFVNDIFECIATEASELVHTPKTQLSLHASVRYPSALHMERTHFGLLEIT